MPTYGYRCTVCAHEFERFQKITEPAITECESCNGAVKKILYPVGIQFVGSGFYVNDYAKSGGGSAKGSASESTAETKSETKSETKTEAKAEPTPGLAAKPAADSSKN
ncbi:MAG TPA: FmdB family zinc ribbon protein [Armatimonadaceae bacterium]|nr:FmdB family zinc ribbon protein [Armatimonadaceae bacterium]